MTPNIGSQLLHATYNVLSLTVTKSQGHKNSLVQIPTESESEARKYVDVELRDEIEKESVVYDEIGEIGLQVRDISRHHLPRNSMQINDFYHSTEF